MFGGGIYNCVGQHLARMEIQEIIKALATRFAKAELVGKYNLADTNAATEVKCLNLRLH